MPRSRRSCVFTSLALLALAVGCTHAVVTNDAGENMLAAVSDADRESDRHAAACDAAASLETMMSELSRHEDAMGGILMRMDDARDDMRMGSMMSMHCSGQRFDQMSTSLSELHAEMASHADRMREATTLGDAQDECAAHTDVTHEMTHSMHDDLDEMPCMHP